MKWQLKLALALLAVVLLPGRASAGLITVNQTLDVTAPMAGGGNLGWQDPPAFNGGYSVDIAEGDTFSYTIDFLGNQSLTVTNLSFVWAYSYAAVGEQPSNVDGTGKFSFLDENGVSILDSDLKTDTEGAAHFGQYFFASDFAGGLPASLTFFGVRYEGVLSNYGTGSLTTRTYDTPAFYFRADSISTVPEPSSLALVGLGITGLVGGYFRRKKCAIGG